MIQNTISQKRARDIYDRMGARYDWFNMFEGKAKEKSLAMLEPSPGQNLLNVGVGTGKEHTQLHSAVSPGGQAFALDLSPVMVRLAKARTSAPIFLSDVGNLPLAPNQMDSLYCAYVLDLLPLSAIPEVLSAFHKVLKPDGRMVILALTEGVSPTSRALVSLWKRLYANFPIAFAGCRPLQLLELVRQAGFAHIQREVVVQMALPSEIILAFS